MQSPIVEKTEAFCQADFCLAFFKSNKDAQFLVDNINKELKMVDPSIPLCRVKQDKTTKNFFVEIPRIFLKIKQFLYFRNI